MQGSRACPEHCVLSKPTQAKVLPVRQACSGGHAQAGNAQGSMLTVGNGGFQALHLGTVGVGSLQEATVVAQHLLAPIASQLKEGVRGKHDGAVGQHGVGHNKVLRQFGGWEATDVWLAC